MHSLPSPQCLLYRACTPLGSFHHLHLCHASLISPRKLSQHTRVAVLHIRQEDGGVVSGTTLSRSYASAPSPLALESKEPKEVEQKEVHSSIVRRLMERRRTFRARTPTPASKALTTESNEPEEVKQEVECNVNMRRLESRDKGALGARLRSRSPSSSLIKALQNNKVYRLEHPRGEEVDHSYISALNLQRRKHAGHYVRHRSYYEDDHDIPAEATLQSVLAKYVEFCCTLESEDCREYIENYENEVLLRVFDEASLALLSKRGYDIEDVITWAWIILAPSSLQAALRLLAASDQSRCSSPRPIPTFVFLLILRRERIPTRALKLLILHGSDRLENRLNPNWPLVAISVGDESQPLPSPHAASLPHAGCERACYPVMNEQTMTIMVVRLLRHANRQWPAAIPAIVEMLITHAHEAFGKQQDANVLSTRSLNRLTFLFNRILSLIAKPSARNPFLSIIHQERAQFNIIRKMTEFQPALIVNREGYRAIIGVQVAHRKTLAERNWAFLKSKAWPPWREDKLGIHAGKDDDMGISRANRALRNLNESGYSVGPWEDAARILSGWDTDQSPTVQKRAIFRPDVAVRRISQTKHIKDDPFDSLVWEARIQATRTIEEAWSCFLSYQKEAKLYTNVYAAMLQKLAFEEKRNSGLDNNTAVSTSLGDQEISPASGDMLELESSSTNPREMTYIPTPPPSFTEFAWLMIKKGVKPHGRLLGLMLDHATTIDEGYRFLEASDLSPAYKGQLQGVKEINPECLEVPRSVFTAYIGFLVRFPFARIPRNVGYNASDQLIQNQRSAASHAMELVLSIKPPYTAPWNVLLSALAGKNLQLSKASYPSPGKRDVEIWASLFSFVNQMEKAEVGVDFTTFHILCAKLEKMCRDSRPKDYGSEQQLPETADASPAKTVFALFASQGLSQLKRMFKNLVSLELWRETPRWAKKAALSVASFTHPDSGFASPNLLPHLLQVPSPANVHAFMRALGSARDDEGIVDLLRWMAFASPQLEVVAQELRNGPRLFRFTLIAARVYLERSWNEATENVKEELALGSLIDEAISIIESVESWNGWPTNDEVYEYCRKGHWNF